MDHLFSVSHISPNDARFESLYDFNGKEQYAIEQELLVDVFSEMDSIKNWVSMEFLYDEEQSARMDNKVQKFKGLLFDYKGCAKGKIIFYNNGDYIPWVSDNPVSSKQGIKTLKTVSE